MIQDKPFKIVWGVWAVSIYMAVIAAIVYYFNVRNQSVTTHFVKKNEHRIQVALSAPKTSKKNKKTIKTKKSSISHKNKRAPSKSIHRPKTKAKISPKNRQETKKKTIAKPKSTKKIRKEKVLKKKVAKKPERKIKQKKVKEQPRSKNTKQNLSSLFSKVKTPKKITHAPTSSVSKQNQTHKKLKSASQKITNSLKIQKSSDSGIENKYLAKVEEKLKGWPAQAEYAGEKATVWLKINPSGYFEYKVITASNSQGFNDGLVAYLEQLKRFGFGPHKGNRPYELEVEFIATD